MKNTELMNKLTRTASRIGLQIKKHSPEILLVTGLAGTVVTTVMACKASTKAGAILEEARERIDTVHEIANKPEMAEKYTEEDKKKDLVIVYTQTAVEYAKLYGPSVVMGVASIACILASHKIIRTRNAALATAYSAIHDGFKEYRGRVVERLGKEMDRELLYNIRAKEITETVVDENGNEETVTTVVEAADPNAKGMYIKCFDETCRGWQRDAELNHYFLRQVQQWANEKLQKQGHLTLNEVYEQLGFMKTKDGAVVGWVYNEEHPVGDNYVDFGIYDLRDEDKRAFVNGYEKSIWLDFNVDGYIVDLI